MTSLTKQVWQRIEPPSHENEHESRYASAAENSVEKRSRIGRPASIIRERLPAISIRRYASTAQLAKTKASQRNANVINRRAGCNCLLNRRKEVEELRNELSKLGTDFRQTNKLSPQNSPVMSAKPLSGWLPEALRLAPAIKTATTVYNKHVMANGNPPAIQHSAVKRQKRGERANSCTVLAFAKRSRKTKLLLLTKC